MSDKTENVSFGASISPVAYVKKKVLLFLSFIEMKIPNVPFKQSVKLQQKLNLAGVSNEFITDEVGKMEVFKEIKTPKSMQQ